MGAAGRLLAGVVHLGLLGGRRQDALRDVFRLRLSRAARVQARSDHATRGALREPARQIRPALRGGAPLERAGFDADAIPAKHLRRVLEPRPLGPRSAPLPAAALIAALALAAAATATRAEEEGEWRMPARDFAATRYSPLADIHAANVR